MSTRPVTTSPQDRLLQVLATVAQSSGALSAAELGAMTGLPKSSLYRQLARLRHWGFVQEVDGGYAPGPMGLQLAQGFDATSHLVQEAREDMHKLVRQSGESVGLIVAVNDRAICIEMLESPQALRCSFEKGRSVALRRGATAKCLLAHLPQARRRAVLDAADDEPHPRDATWEELEVIRQAGYARSQSEIDEGVWGASAPIFGGGQHLLGCLTLMAPVARALPREAELTQMVIVAAARISRNLNL
ncbi:IclR family transcriptional regulator [Verticiella sediminum]|uniref:IclR family transcriptional regulator n=1 Tax=Verticiella sediminum TaxID=1247510 RepID=A0A556AY44_9BURK|nr:IclR family transcriptional regulator [Verticiella sediminum]TSH97395.1 IclR family transcriptional regulator [Verticiella sediminum]